jgi:hypothetical protein
MTPMASAIQAPSLSHASCNCRGTGPLTDKEREQIVERLLNPHVFAPYGKAMGMLSEYVKDSDFECCPLHPNRASCPANGCKHCMNGEGK